MHVYSDRITHPPRNSINTSFQIPVSLNPIWNPGNLEVSCSCFVLPAYSLSHLRCHPWAKSSLWSPSIHLDQNKLNSKNCWIRFWECLIHWDGLMVKACHPCAMFDSIFLGEACISASVFWSKIFMVHQYIHKQHNYITGVLQNEMIHMQF